MTTLLFFFDWFDIHFGNLFSAFSASACDAPRHGFPAAGKEWVPLWMACTKLYGYQ